ncbi:MAG TPA: SDR family oxidoreductase [Nonomuraea sp.]|nr:SDR family oxidoreductase [Nonomuraea sp.]
MTILVAGASGVIGQAAVERLLADGMDVVALSRRPPDVDPHPRLRHLAVDLMDAAACQDVLGRLAGVTHLVYAALFEKPGLMAGWLQEDQMQTNLAMLTNLVEALVRAPRPALRHVSLMQGAKAYGGHVHPPRRIPSREREPRDPHPNFYWLQEDYLRQAADRHGFEITIFRPQMLVGGATGSAMNVVPVIGVYAALCARLGMPFGFPGGRSYVWEAVDARIVAAALSWAMSAPAAWGETFNITNGDVFEWRDLWPAIAAELGVEPAADTPRSLADFLPRHEHVWAEIVRTHGLRPLPLPVLLGQSHHYADKCFAYGSDEPMPPKFLSTVKLRQAGFHDCLDTEDSFRYWLAHLRERRILPAKHP